MAIKRIIKDIDINASAEKVWQVLFDDATYRIRAAEFMAGSYADTDRKEGSRVQFLGEDKSGIAGFISKNTPHEHLEITYDAFVGKGIEDTESPEVQEFKGATETYTLTEENGVTHLHTEADMDANWFDDMNTSRDRAMLKIKELSEQAV